MFLSFFFSLKPKGGGGGSLDGVDSVVKPCQMSCPYNKYTSGMETQKTSYILDFSWLGKNTPHWPF